MWIYFGLLSALFLGMYDVSRKHAVENNAVLPVLFLSSVFAALVAAAIVVFSKLYPAEMVSMNLYVPALCWVGHLQLLAKSAIISAAWVLAYYALKHLPLSLASPISASGPVWTLIAAMLIFHERPNTLQYIGFGLIVLSYCVFSLIGSKEGIAFYSNKWVIFTFLATLMGAFSAIYDKFLIQTLGYSPVTVQMWFIIYLVPLLGLTLLASLYPAKASTPTIMSPSPRAVATIRLFRSGASQRPRT